MADSMLNAASAALINASIIMAEKVFSEGTPEDFTPEAFFNQLLVMGSMVYLTADLAKEHGVELSPLDLTAIMLEGLKARIAAAEKPVTGTGGYL